MKILKRLLVFLLTVGIIGGIWGLNKFKVQSSPLRQSFAGQAKFKVEETRNEEKNQPLKFAVMSDIHSDWENFRKAIEKVKGDMENEGNKGFVIITGDLTTIGKKNELLEAKKILDESGLKYYVVPGNHDVWWERKFKDDIWKAVFGESFTSFKDDGEKFILINNGDGVGGVGGVRGVGNIREMDWLKKEVEECVRVYCLVFLHMPLNHPTSLHVMGEENPSVASEAAELVRLLVKNKVKDVFAGHLHFSSSYELDGLKTTVVGAVSAERNFQSPKFLAVEIQNSDLEKKEVFLTP